MKKDNINFFKKIYFSICKVKEYGKLSREGLKKSIYYTMDLIVICAIIYASIYTIKIKINANGLQGYLEENFPELTYENNALVSEKTERIVLDDKLVKANFGGQLIIDTVTDYTEVIKEYENCGEPSILLTFNKYVTVNSQGDVYEYDYSTIINTEEKTTIGKEYFVKLFSNISYTYYFCGYLIEGAIGTSIIVYLYNLLITVIAFIFCKIRKIKLKFKQIYSMGLYANTISIIGICLIDVLPTVIVPYVQVLIFLIPAIYLGYVIVWAKRRCLCP